MSALEERLRALAPALPRLLRGIEKESLRVRPDGSLALTPHPAGLGSALTHPHVTTDFSESQLELITGAHASVRELTGELTELHAFVLREIGDELMWCASMPCQLPEEHSIPLGRYGTSNIGRAKTVYRTGLAYRYGRRMQTISGMHYNFSVAPDVWPIDGVGDANEGYFALIRNFRRHAWLLLYLFGASPAVCSSFVAGRQHALTELAPGTLHLPYATSLRMGRLGYLSEAQDALAVSYNDLESYGESLADALTRPYPPYEAIGIRDGDEYRQLSTTLLQIENEFYSTIRPKRVIEPGERPLHALRERGVEYVEVRAMDLDPFSAIGIAPATSRFLDVFLLHCLLTDSALDSPQEVQSINRNKQRVAQRGREPGLRLDRDGEEIELHAWAREILAQCMPIAAVLDTAYRGDGYAQAVAAAQAVVREPDALPSARMLREIRERYDGSYVRFVLAYSQRHRETLTAEPLSAEIQARMVEAATASLDKQRRIEAADIVDFETFRRRYLSPESLVVR